jgi:hypothetical protein
MSNNHSDIVDVLESIRAKKFSRIPSDLVEEVVEAEYETLEKRDESLGEVSKIIESYAQEVNTENAED